MTSELPVLSADTQRELETQISLEELSAALNTLKVDSAPGPDGFTVHYYMKFFLVLGPHMVSLLNGLRSTTSLHCDTLKAHISLIPKEGKDLAACGSYRPISLLNTDLKMFTKLLALDFHPIWNNWST